MKVTSENYFSRESAEEYLSVSQYKEFAGCIGREGCEAKAIAKLQGEWEDEKTTALMVGSYIDAHFEGTLDLFKAQNPDLFMKNGGLKSDYRKAEEIINRIERDPLFMRFMSGQKQVIMTGELYGAKWKIKMDSYLPGKAIVDLKVMRAISGKDATFYVKDCGSYVNFVENWGYDIQGAIYREIEYQNRLAVCTTDEEKAAVKKLPFFLAAASKEPEPDIEVIYIPDDILDERLTDIEKNVPKILALKAGEYKPLRCGHCDYCRHTKVLSKPIHYSELLGET